MLLMIVAAASATRDKRVACISPFEFVFVKLLTLQLQHVGRGLYLSKDLIN